jgi:hypothetical protein
VAKISAAGANMMAECSMEGGKENAKNWRGKDYPE